MCNEAESGSLNATAHVFAAQGFAPAIAHHLRLIGYLLNG
jgi:hypothetical protein